MTTVFTLLVYNLFQCLFQATCSSVLAATLNQLNQNCVDKIQLVNKECNERIQTLDLSLVTGEDCCRNVESLSQEIEMLKTKNKAKRESLSGKIIIIFCFLIYNSASYINIPNILKNLFSEKIMNNVMTLAFQRKMCEVLLGIDGNDVNSRNACLECIVIANEAECSAKQLCEFDPTKGLCIPPPPGGK